MGRRQRLQEDGCGPNAAQGGLRRTAKASSHFWDYWQVRRHAASAWAPPGSLASTLDVRDMVQEALCLVRAQTNSQHHKLLAHISTHSGPRLDRLWATGPALFARRLRPRAGIGAMLCGGPCCVDLSK